MSEDDPRPAIHATSTSALRAVAAMLAVVLLLAAATTVLDVLPIPRPPHTAANTDRAARHPAQLDTQPVRAAADSRP
ncbi:hypothetical protein [Amycolatopsis sp. cmx-4-68]|uniref:hypothetical protein n=1 Tax=Amycolatopsis sp. cmx-4-68 TaxID=2790938 RepID=UPI00397914FA